MMLCHGHVCSSQHMLNVHQNGQKCTYVCPRLIDEHASINPPAYSIAHFVITGALHTPLHCEFVWVTTIIMHACEKSWLTHLRSAQYVIVLCCAGQKSHAIARVSPSLALHV